MRRLHWCGLLAVGSLFGVSLLTCSISVDCGGTSVAFILPEPGDEVAMRTSICIEPAEDGYWSIWVELDSDELQSVELTLQVDDPVEESSESMETSGGDPALIGEGYAWGSFQREHCDEGIGVVLRRGADTEVSAAVGWIHVTGGKEEPSVCTTSWQRSDDR